MKDVKPIFKDHTGRWRESNPHDEWQGVYEHGRYIANEKNPEHKKFEQSIQYHEFLNPPEVNPGEVVMAYLQWQLKFHDWTDGDMEPFENFDEFKKCCDENGQQSRQIWVAANQSEKPFWEKAHDILVDGREASRGNDVQFCDKCDYPVDHEVHIRTCVGVPNPKSDHITDAEVSAFDILEQCNGEPFSAMEQYATLKAQSLLADKDKEIAELKQALKNTRGIMHSIMVGSYEYHEIRQLAVRVKNEIDNALK